MSHAAQPLTATIDCIGTDVGWKYRVTLWCGKVAYIGQRTYERYQDAQNAATRSGATVKEPK